MLRRVPAVFAFLVLLPGCSSKTVAPSPPPPQTSGVNQPPTTWFAGSDPDDPAAGWQVATGLFGGRYMDLSLTGWATFQGVPNSLLGPDSLLALPGNRPPRKTFYEVYDDRQWIRQEGDTVHLNSWVIFPGGGSDPDSPYKVNVNTALLPDELKGKPVLTPGPANGSAVGLRLRVQVKDAAGRVSQPSETTTFPVFDPASVLHDPIVNGYWALTSAGKAYATLHAVDGDGSVDRSVDQRPGGAVGIADRVDEGGGSAEDVALRARVLTFFVDHPPVLLRDRPEFTPRDHQVFASRDVRLTSFASDDDWLDPTLINRPGGTPNYPSILRWKVAVLGKLAGTDQDTCYVVPTDFTSAISIQFTIPAWIASGPITIRIRLCDCQQCDVSQGTRTCPFESNEVAPQQGSCTDTDIPCQLNAPGLQALGYNPR